MNYDKFLQDTLQAIESMPIERFEEICIGHGYTPKRKATFIEKQDFTNEGFSTKSYKMLSTKVSDAANDNLFNISDCDFADAA